MNGTKVGIVLAIIVAAGCGDGADVKANPSDAANAATLVAVLGSFAEEGSGLPVPQETLCEQAARQGNLLCAGDERLAGGFEASNPCDGAEEAASLCVILEGDEGTCDGVLACGLEPASN